MGDGKFKISGSQTGNYYVVKNGKRTYYDKKGNIMQPSAFLQAEGATIAKDGSMRKSKNVDAKSKLVKHRLPGSKTGRYYTEDAHGNKTYYAANGTPIRPDYFYQEENKAINAAKNKSSQAAAPKKKSWWDKVKSFGKKCWDGAKAFGKGMVKSVTKMFTDENGKFSWKQTFKTVGTCLAVTVGAAALVAAEVLTAGQVTWLLVGAGAVMGAGTVAKGVVQYSNANTREEKLAAIETMGEGTGEIGMAALTKRPMGASMKAVSAASKAERMAALASGSGRTVAWAKGVGAGMKTVVPSPKQAWEGIQNGTKTAYNAVRHPVKTTRTALQNRRARIQARESIKGDVETIRTQEDLVAARKRVNESDVLTPKQKAKLNKKLDKINKEELPHQDIAALRERYESSEMHSETWHDAGRNYHEALRRSTDRAALETRRSELNQRMMQESNVYRTYHENYRTMDESALRSAVDRKIDSHMNQDAEVPYSTEALIDGIRVNENISPAVKAELLTRLESNGIKPSSPELSIINERIGAIDQMQRTEFTDLISQAELKPLTRRQKLTNKVKTKKHKTQTEYDTLKARIQNEVKSPELRTELLKKLEAKQKLLDDIGAMKKRPTFDEYKDIINRADGDEYALSLILKKLSKDHSYFKSPTTKAQRSQLYREIFKKQNKINPEKYPDIETELVTRDNLNKNKTEAQRIEEELASAKRELDIAKQELEAAKNQKMDAHAEVNEVINRNGRIKELETKINKLNQEIQSLETTRQSQLRTRSNEYDAHRTASDEMHNQRNVSEGYRAQQARAQRELEISKLKERKMETKIEHTQAEINRLRTKSQTSANEINGLAKEYAKQMAKDPQYKWMTEEKRLKFARENILQDNLSVFRNTKDVTYPTLKLKTKRAIDRAVKQIKENSTKISELEATQRGQVSELEAFRREEILFKEQEVKRYRQLAETAERDLAAAKNERAQHGEEIKRIKDEIRETETQLRAKEEELTRLDNDKTANRTRVKELQNEIRDVRRNLAERKARLADAERNFSAAENRVRELEADLNTVKENIRINTEALNNLKARPHKSGGALLGGITATQANQVAGEHMQSAMNLLAALAMEEGEMPDEAVVDETGEATEDSGEALEEEAIEDAAADAVDDGTVADNSDGTTVTDGTTTPDSNASTTPDGNTTPGGKASTTPDGNTTPGGKASTTPDGNTTPGGNASTTPDGNITPGGNASTTPDGNITPDGKDKPEGVTIQTYVSGRDSEGGIREITPAERMLITQQIERAQTIEDIALIYTELRSFKKFEGRKNLLKAIKQKRKSIEGKKNNYYERYGKIQDSKVYREDAATIKAKPEQKTTVYETSNLGEVDVVEKKKPFFRRIFGGGDYNPYLVKANGENPERITLEVPTVIAEGEVKEPETPVIPAAEAAAANAPTSVTPQVTEQTPVNNSPEETTPPEQKGQSDGDMTLNFTDGNPFDIGSPENLTAEVPTPTTDDSTTGQDEKIQEQPLVAQVDVPPEDDEPKHKLDIGEGWV